VQNLSIQIFTDGDVHADPEKVCEAVRHCIEACRRGAARSATDRDHLWVSYDLHESGGDTKPLVRVPTARPVGVVATGVR
jgi:hypothetical protein